MSTGAAEDAAPSFGQGVSGASEKDGSAEGNPSGSVEVSGLSKASANSKHCASLLAAALKSWTGTQLCNLADTAVGLAIRYALVLAGRAGKGGSTRANMRAPRAQGIGQMQPEISQVMTMSVCQLTRLAARLDTEAEDKRTLLQRPPLVAKEERCTMRAKALGACQELAELCGITHVIDAFGEADNAEKLAPPMLLDAPPAPAGPTGDSALHGDSRRLARRLLASDERAQRWAGVTIVAVIMEAAKAEFRQQQRSAEQAVAKLQSSEAIVAELCQDGKSPQDALTDHLKQNQYAGLPELLESLRDREFCAEALEVLRDDLLVQARQNSTQTQAKLRIFSDALEARSSMVKAWETAVSMLSCSLAHVVESAVQHSPTDRPSRVRRSMQVDAAGGQLRRRLRAKRARPAESERDNAATACEDQAESKKGVILFVDDEGKEREITFTRGPIGITCGSKKELPITVEAVRGHASDLGVQVGWKFKAIEGEDVAGQELSKLREDLVAFGESLSKVLCSKAFGESLSKVDTTPKRRRCKAEPKVSPCAKPRQVRGTLRQEERHELSSSTGRPELLPAPSEELEQRPHMLKTYHRWLMESCSMKKMMASRYTTFLRQIMEKTGSCISCTLTSEFIEWVRASEENQRQHQVVGSLKSFHLFLRSRGGFMPPWEETASECEQKTYGPTASEIKLFSASLGRDSAE